MLNFVQSIRSAKGHLVSFDAPHVDFTFIQLRWWPIWITMHLSLTVVEETVYGASNAT